MTVTDSKIVELIKTNSGYSAQVDLNLWFHDNTQNLATIRRYKPIASHRRAFERIAGALDNKDKRVYLVTGNYGTGKSHLCLMLANYFAYPVKQPDVAKFLDNYAEENPAAAEKLRARRRKGRYLVALCDYDSTDDFGEIVLRAVLDPLKEAGLSDVLATPFEEARGKLDRLEEEQKAGKLPFPFYERFESQVPNYLAGVKMSAFKDRLYPGMDRTALDVFRRMHQEILRTPFTYEAGNLSAILRSTLRSDAFLEQFEGIVVFWDEFGYTLGDPNRLSLNVFQQFAQLCKVLVRDAACAVWLERFAGSYNDTDVCYSVRTARDLLAERWQAKIPDRVADAEILASGFLEQDIVPRAGQSYDEIVLEHYWGEFFTFVRFPLTLAGELIDSLDPERWQANRTRPLAMQALQACRERWLDQAPKGDLKKLIEAIFENPAQARDVLGCYKLVRKYPSQVGRAVLGDWYTLFGKLEIDPTPVGLDGVDLGKAVQEIQYYLNGLTDGDQDRL